MIYKISYQNPNSHYIDISIEIECKGENEIELQLPSWRPGRYELANFAKNIQYWKAVTETGKELPFKKLTKDRWRVETKKEEKVFIEYNYFAFELNAGSTYLDEEQLYVNPVNCLLYNPNKQEEECFLELEIPENYQVATSLDKLADHIYKAKGFDELADSPFIASASLLHFDYKVKGSLFHIWFQGELKGDFKKLIQDFKKFSQEQVKLFREFESKEYHFLFQILTKSAYHGVEHSKSTVIALGPSYDILKLEGRYEDLLGVSSHELFHYWNVKRIRPIEMWPYDFTKENYSRLGYLCEGATTWYGDVMLLRSGVFSENQFFKTFNQLLDRHYNNPGVLNLSVADSSFDTWLDGYVVGVPNRKSSIYTEGALVTFMLDAHIRDANKNKKSFDEVLRTFYEEFYKEGKGISEEDYQRVVESVYGKSLKTFFHNYIYDSKDYTKALKSALNQFGLDFKSKANPKKHESYLGFILLDKKVISIFPNSPAEVAGLSIKDEIIAINGIALDNNLSEWCAYFKDQEITLTIIDEQARTKSISMQYAESLQYATYEVYKLEKQSKKQKENWEEFKLTKR